MMKNTLSAGIMVALAVGFVCTTVAQGQSSDLLDSLTRAPQFTSHRASSSNEDLNRNGDARGIPAGETLVLADLQGPGIITHMWCTVGSYDPFYPSALILRIYYDGAEKPSVQVPLGDFFGVGHAALSEFTSMPVCNTSHGRARACFWKMPFQKSAKVTITNDSPTQECDSFYYYIDWQKHESLPPDTTYFCAQYRQQTPAQPGDYVILETTGQGQYVGTVHSVLQMENGWYGEGDDRFWIDGEETPSLKGTGTEDYFNDAWGFRKFSTPFYGVSLWDGYFAGDRVTAYRWHLTDPVAFQKSLKVSMEHRGSILTDTMIDLGGFNERPDWVSSVAFWYQNPPAAIEPMPALAERLPPYKVLMSDALQVRADPTVILLKQEQGVFYIPAMKDASLELSFEVEEKGTYVLGAFMPHAFVGGVYQPLMDGKAFGAPIDFYADGMDILYVRLDRHNLDAGKHTLRFEGRGLSPKMRAPAQPLCAIGMYALVLLRLEDMKGFHEKSQELEKAGGGKKIF